MGTMSRKTGGSLRNCVPQTLTVQNARLARRLLRPLRAELLQLVIDLVRTNTVAIPPDGNETPGQLVLRRFLRRHKMHSELYEMEFITTSSSPWKHTDRHYSGRKNLVARLAGSGGGRSLLLSGHMDTVPTRAAAWTTSPWSPEIRKGRLYGLGAFDMKAGLAAQAVALCALSAGGARLRGDLIFESVVDEEWGGGGGTLAGRLRADMADACIISESTQLEVFRATRGGFVVDLSVNAGDASAYFSSSPVISPAVPLGRLLKWVDGWVKRRSHKAKRGAYRSIADPTPVQVFAVEANRLDADVPFSVPLKAAVRVYFQFLPHEDVDAVIGTIRESLRRFQNSDPFFRGHPIEWRPVMEPALLGHELPRNHPWTECLFQSASASLGKPPAVTVAPYPCDAFLMQRVYGIPTLLFGPCGGGAHNPDEYVESRSVLQTAEVLLMAALEWSA
jgi:acetylornithine deacetylase